MSLGIVFLSEVFGTMMLTLLGCGVVANVALKGTKGNNGGFLMVTWGAGGVLRSSRAFSWPQSPVRTLTRPSPWACWSTEKQNTPPAFPWISPPP